MTYILGLTGSIATGKSTVSNIFKALGFPVVDADIGAREVVEVGAPGLQALVDYFGQGLLTHDGQLNREALGAIVFANEAKRKKLNELLKPYIRSWIDREKNKVIASGAPLVIMDIPLLYEAGGYQEMMDSIMVVAIPDDLQITRLMARNQLSRSEALQRIKAQIPIAKKVEWADSVIDNSGSLVDTRQQVEKWLQEKNLFPDQS